jgi:hypothetical protein
MKKMKMSEEELIAELRSDLALCVPEYSSVADQRASALKYYMAEPFGNEVEGRSQVVTTDVADTIEGVLPPLLKMFTSSDDVAVFDPVGPEDEEQALQESDYINHVFFKDNEGFQILYTWFKDALLSKNGVIKYFWEEDTEEVHETYEGLQPMQLDMLLQDDNIEIKSQSFVVDEQTQATSISLEVMRSNKKGRVKLVCVPPEKFKVSPEHNSILLKDVPFCCHETDKWKWELEKEGYDKDKIDQLYYETDLNSEYQARFADIDAGTALEDSKKVTIQECYKRCDWDGDGYPELRKITLGNESVILDNVEIDYMPFEAITPIPMTHRFVGRSYADITMDLQKIKSTLLRNIFDNLYLINNQRTGIVDGEVNVDDLLDNRPGGVIRMTAPGMVFPIATAGFPPSAYNMLEYVDGMREQRTGVTRYNQGMDANSLNKTAAGINRIMDAAQERVLLVAKLFGDGLKRLLLGIHRLLIQHQDVERVVRLRGKWVAVNPSEWRERENMTINVALGTNDKQSQIQSLFAIGNVQKEMMQAGLSNMVSPNHLYNTAKKLVEATGMKHHEYFFSDPAQSPPPEPKPDPEGELQKAMAQAELMKAQTQARELELKAEVERNKFQLELKKLELEYAKVQLDSERAALDGLQKNNRLDLSKYQTDVKVKADLVMSGADQEHELDMQQRQAKSDIIKEMVNGPYDTDDSPSS